MSKLLLTYASQALGQRVCKWLKPSFQIIPVTSEPVPSVLASMFVKIPNSSNPVFAHEILKLCLDKDVQYILPLSTCEAAALQEASILFEEFGIVILSPNSKQYVPTIDKPGVTSNLILAHNGVSLTSDEQLEAKTTGLFVTISNVIHQVALNI